MLLPALFSFLLLLLNKAVEFAREGEISLNPPGFEHLEHALTLHPTPLTDNLGLTFDFIESLLNLILLPSWLLSLEVNLLKLVESNYFLEVALVHNNQGLFG